MLAVAQKPESLGHSVITLESSVPFLSSDVFFSNITLLSKSRHMISRSCKAIVSPTAGWMQSLFGSADYIYFRKPPSSCRA